MLKVWQTRGVKFHSRADCVSLLAGQEKAASEGRPTYAPVLKSLSEIRGEYDPCRTCWKDEEGWFDGWLPVQLRAEHQAGQSDGSPWEPIFLREVLQKLPVSPLHVTVQDVVDRPYGAALRPDFTIKVPKWQQLAIEIDGDKERWYENAPSRDQVLTRADELEQLGWRVERFTNTQVTQKPEWCRQKLARVLDDLKSAAELADLAETKAAASVLSPNTPSSPSSPVAASPTLVSTPAEPPQRRGRLLVISMLAGFVCLLLVGGLAIGLVARNKEPVLGRAPDASGECPTSHPVKGNVSGGGERIFHEPGWEFYDVTTPVECFTGATEADAAGYRASLRR